MSEKLIEFKNRDITNILTEYCEKFYWKNDGTDTLINIGYGTGNSTVDHVRLIMPKNYKRLSGCDISRKMVDYSDYFLYKNENIDFFEFDIECDLIMDVPQLISEFDHVISLKGLELYKNQRF